MCDDTSISEQSHKNSCLARLLYAEEVIRRLHVNFAALLVLSTFAQVALPLSKLKRRRFVMWPLVYYFVYKFAHKLMPRITIH
jgi:hypothetical protein